MTYVQELVWIFQYIIRSFFPFFPVNKNNPQSFYPGKMLISFKVTRTSRIWKNLIMQHSISYGYCSTFFYCIKNNTFSQSFLFFRIRTATQQCEIHTLVVCFDILSAKNSWNRIDMLFNNLHCCRLFFGLMSSYNNYQNEPLLLFRFHIIIW